MRGIISILLCSPVLLLVLWSSPAGASILGPSDFFVTELELTGGSVDFHGRFARKLDHLFDQSGQIVINDYQPIGDIVPSIMRGHRTFSLFTAGFNGAPAPSAAIDGSSITVDLSSLFFAVSRGDHFRIWNIGGVATGRFDQDTLEFCLTWDHLFSTRPRLGPATFWLHGTVNLVNTEPVPLVTTTVLFATGLAMLMGVWRRKATRAMAEAIPAV
jgi:hypothetical protein